VCVPDSDGVTAGRSCEGGSSLRLDRMGELGEYGGHKGHHE